MREECQSFANGTIGERPVKVKKLKRSTRYFNYLVIKHPDFQILEKRTSKDIWRDLYQFPLIETQTPVAEFTELMADEHWPAWLSAVQTKLLQTVGPRKQELTHQRIIATFWELDYTGDLPAELPDGLNLVKPENCRKFAVPKVISWYFDDNSLYLF